MAMALMPLAVEALWHLGGSGEFGWWRTDAGFEDSFSNALPSGALHVLAAINLWVPTVAPLIVTLLTIKGQPSASIYWSWTIVCTSPIPSLSSSSGSSICTTKTRMDNEVLTLSESLKACKQQQSTARLDHVWGCSQFIFRYENGDTYLGGVSKFTLALYLLWRAFEGNGSPSMIDGIHAGFKWWWDGM